MVGDSSLTNGFIFPLGQSFRTRVGSCLDDHGATSSRVSGGSFSSATCSVRAIRTGLPSQDISFHAVIELALEIELPHALPVIEFHTDCKAFCTSLSYGLIAVLISIAPLILRPSPEVLC